MMIFTKHVTQHAMKMKDTEFLNIQLLWQYAEQKEVPLSMYKMVKAHQVTNVHVSSIWLSLSCVNVTSCLLIDMKNCHTCMDNFTIKNLLSFIWVNSSLLGWQYSMKKSGTIITIFSPVRCLISKQNNFLGRYSSGCLPNTLIWSGTQQMTINFQALCRWDTWQDNHSNNWMGWCAGKKILQGTLGSAWEEDSITKDHTKQKE